jgi:flagellar biosynthesis protein FlhB
MAEQPDKESKTEEATPRRVEEARGKGNTPVSREVGPFASITAIAVSLPVAHDLFWADGVRDLGALFDRAADMRLNSSEDAVLVVAAAGQMVAKLVVVPLSILMVFGILAAVAQNPVRLVGERITPDFSRVSIGKGLGRLFGLQNAVEFLKVLFKFGFMASIVAGFLLHYKVAVLNAVAINPRDLPGAVMQYAGNLFKIVAGILAILVAADVFWSRMKWHIDLRMSKQEIKDEQKQAEGDPIVRARQRSLARDRSRRRMMAAVPRATVVIANPTHYAVALRYVREESATPVVIAKGLDNIAIRIRELAEQNGIPVIEDKALARSLYAAVVLDRPIPPDFYKAIAEIILFMIARKSPTPSLQT